MNKMLIVVITLGALAFLGCTKNNVVKEKAIKEVSENEKNYIIKEKVMKEVSQNEKKYIIVIEKSIKDCKEHGIILDEQRTNSFMRRSPQSTIDKTASDTRKMPKKLCQFFAGETSLEKIENTKLFTSKIMNACEKNGVTLAKEKLHKKIANLPFFVIKKGLMMSNETRVEECELMAKTY